MLSGLMVTSIDPASRRFHPQGSGRTGTVVPRAEDATLWIRLRLANGAAAVTFAKDDVASLPVRLNPGQPAAVVRRGVPELTMTQLRSTER